MGLGLQDVLKSGGRLTRAGRAALKSPAVNAAAAEDVGFVLGKTGALETGEKAGRRLVNFADGSSDWVGQASNLPALPMKKPEIPKIDTYGGIFDHIMGNSNWGGFIGKGVAYGAGASAVGSMGYAMTKAIFPNNTEVENPFRNIVKGGAIGAGLGAILAASRGGMGMAGKGLLGPAGVEKMAGMYPKLSTVQNALSHKGTVAALAAAGAAMSGDFSFTKPVNPVY